MRGMTVFDLVTGDTRDMSVVGRMVFMFLWGCADDWGEVIVWAGI
jgi:hypothetical protein